ncbi:MAG: hypothetical protein A2Y17_03785 [Clostridiales bacterium GWF2_38_85]|nr:MAG: hypothetical protein A2Y17_03785 [Clostridiales bacterium GWF2_38_85]HBL83915.1 hypothetical protein [Clostridiales bacterium]
MRKASVIFIVISIVLLLASCSSSAPVAKIYGYENGELTTLYRNVTAENEEFVIELINNKTPQGYASGQEKPNFAIVYNSGTEGEYTYLIMADLETDVITYITDSYDETIAAMLYSSYTTALDFYDFISTDK